MTMAKVASLDEARVKRELTSQVFDCGKCHEQAAELHEDGTIHCGGRTCTARWAATWYKPTNHTSVAKHRKPRMKKNGTAYRCGYCLFRYFHIQSDGSITCYRETCKRKALFRWKWLEDLPTRPRSA